MYVCADLRTFAGFLCTFAGFLRTVFDVFFWRFWWFLHDLDLKRSKQIYSNMLGTKRENTTIILAHGRSLAVGNSTIAALCSSKFAASKSKLKPQVERQALGTHLAKSPVSCTWQISANTGTHQEVLRLPKYLPVQPNWTAPCHSN